ncbi:hypothetical protein [Enterococcus gilvus]|uniref:hypothetical protein n=1 Tax=Enterococcus gilvus TaxID=160453 RepID=UPI0028D5087A|nr:hypothetical protein [Enterococcus gilvus]
MIDRWNKPWNQATETSFTNPAVESFKGLLFVPVLLNRHQSDSLAFGVSDVYRQAGS